MITDVLAFLFIGFFLLSGWHKGLTKTIIGPLSTIICTMATFTYINQLGPWKSLALLVFGPLVLSMTVSILLKIWNKLFDNNQSPLWFSRVLGGVISLLWGGAMVGLALILFGLLPPKIFGQAAWREDIISSYSYRLVYNSVFHRIQLFNSLETLSATYDDFEKSAALQDTKEFAEIYHHPKIQKILADEKTVALIKQRDIVGLLTNQEVMAVWQDKELMEKFFKLGAGDGTAAK